MARRPFAPRAPAGKRRLYDWEGASSTSLALASASSTSATLFTADKAETIVRIRGQILAQLTPAASTAEDAAIIAAGLIVVSTGATVAVDPFNDPGANWIWHQFILLHTSGVVGAVSDQGDQSGRMVTIDNKSMRKLREDEIVVLRVSNGNANGSPTVDVITAVRLLTQS